MTKGIKVVVLVQPIRKGVQFLGVSVQNNRPDGSQDLQLVPQQFDGPAPFVKVSRVRVPDNAAKILTASPVRVACSISEHLKPSMLDRPRCNALSRGCKDFESLPQHSFLLDHYRDLSVTALRQIRSEE